MTRDWNEIPKTQTGSLICTSKNGGHAFLPNVPNQLGAYAEDRNRRQNPMEEIEEFKSGLDELPDADVFEIRRHGVFKRWRDKKSSSHWPRYNTQHSTYSVVLIS